MNFLNIFNKGEMITPLENKLVAGTKALNTDFTDCCGEAPVLVFSKHKSLLKYYIGR